MGAQGSSRRGHGGIGRRSGLKIRRPQGCGGSSPPAPIAETNNPSKEAIPNAGGFQGRQDLNKLARSIRWKGPRPLQEKANACKSQCMQKPTHAKAIAWKSPATRHRANHPFLLVKRSCQQSSLLKLYPCCHGWWVKVNCFGATNGGAWGLGL